jgi:surface carbohydrate biosynthesis protein
VAAAKNYTLGNKLYAQFRKTQKNRILELVNAGWPTTLLDSRFSVIRIDLEHPNLPLSLNFWRIFLYHRLNVDNQTAFVVALVIYLRVNVVVTYTDNYPFLGMVNSIVPNCRVVAVQNGFRTRDQYVNYLTSVSKTKRMNRQKIHDIYLCWGQRDISLLEELGIHTNLSIPIGSVRDSDFRSRNVEYSEDYELLISYYRPGLMRSIGATAVDRSRKECSERLNRFLEIYCMENNLIPVFLLSPGDDDFKQKQITEISQIYQGTWIPSSVEDNLSSYSMIARSKVVVGIRSSLLVEALGHSKRVLACNLTENDDLDLFDQGICQISNCDYAEFSRHLTNLRNMSDDEWINSTFKMASEYISINRKRISMSMSNFLHYIVENEVESAINSLTQNDSD